MTQQQMKRKIIALEKKNTQLQRQVRKLTAGQKKHDARIEKNRRGIQSLKRRLSDHTKRLNNIGRIAESNRTELYRQRNEVQDVISSVENILQSDLAAEQANEAQRVLTRAKKRRTQINNEVDDRKMFGW